MEEISDPDAALENEPRRMNLIESMTVIIIVIVAWSLVYVVPMNGIHPLFSITGLIPACTAALVGVHTQIRAYWEMTLQALNTRDTLRAILEFTVPTTILTTQLFTGITMFLWTRGILHNTPPRSPEFWVIEKYYAWHVADAIPLLEITKHFKWEPSVRFTDHVSGGLLLGFKVLLIFPLLGVIAATYRVFQDYWSTQLTDNAPGIPLQCRFQNRRRANQRHGCYPVFDSSSVRSCRDPSSLDVPGSGHNNQSVVTCRKVESGRHSNFHRHLTAAICNIFSNSRKAFHRDALQNYKRLPRHSDFVRDTAHPNTCPDNVGSQRLHSSAVTCRRGTHYPLAASMA